MSLAIIDFDLRELIKNKVFSHLSNINLDKYIQPASIDLPVGDVAYLVKQKFLPFSRDVNYIVDKLSLDKIDLTNGGSILFKGQTYLIPILDVNLPENLSVRVSPKSSIGRIDLMVRSVFDNLGLYDTIFEDSVGKLWLEVSPQSFNIRLKKGIAISQLRVFEKSNKLLEFKKDNFLFSKSGNEIKSRVFDKNKLFLSLAVPPKELIGYVAKDTNAVLDMSNFNHNCEDFFYPIYSKKQGKITLENNKFYILYTKENISVPINYSVEMVPFSHHVGELRAHYAGFFDPGFGGELGSTGVLEIRPHETLTVYDGQPICLIEIFENKKRPSISYGENGSNYQGQVGPKLAKYFK